MPTVAELLSQGRNDEVWDICCGYLKLNIEQFMEIQNQLMLHQIMNLSHSALGRKIMGGAWPQTVQDFRKEVPLTTYKNYCPELPEKLESSLPQKPAQWVHTSGRSGEFSCKWIPLSRGFVNEMAPILCGLGVLSAARKWGDPAGLVGRPRIIYTVAPRPYISGTLASILQEQVSSIYYPSLPQAESLPFEERIALGFQESLDSGLDYFFGLSLVLKMVGERFSRNAGQINARWLVSHPKALARLTRGLIQSGLERRHILPRDLWRPKGIITSGLDSSVYRDKIKEMWGRYPLDIYANSEGGVVATQTWDYQDMTFIPNLNFLEFIPEKEHFKWQYDHRYQPGTVLLDEVRPNECYEIVISNFHGGMMTRYRIGDMVRITALRNENLGINIPQMTFERRADDLLDFATIRLNEKMIWLALERSGLPYEDWVAYKKPGEMTLNLLVEPRDGNQISEAEMSQTICSNIVKHEIDTFGASVVHQDTVNTIRMNVKVTSLPPGTFARYIACKKAEGSDIAHLKPPHVNPPQASISLLLNGAGTGIDSEKASVPRGNPVSVR